MKVILAPGPSSLSTTSTSPTTLPTLTLSDREKVYEELTKEGALSLTSEMVTVRSEEEERGGEPPSVATTCTGRERERER